MRALLKAFVTTSFCYFWFLFLPCSSRAQSQNLPLDHWAYPFLERLETKGLFISEDFNTRPFSREAVADILREIHQQVDAQPTLLTRTEWRLFEQLKGDLHEELADSTGTIPVSEKEQHIFSWRREDFVIHFDALLGEQFKVENRQEIDPSIPKSMTSWGLRFRAKIKNSLAIYTETRSFILSDLDSLANTVFNPSLGLPVTQRALVDITVTDNTTAYMVYRLPWFDFEFGRDLVEWGPGFRGNLILSRNSNFYDLLKLTFRYEKFKFEYIHAWLNSEQTKYLAGHRLEIRPSRSFYFGLNETVVYGNRNVELLYLNPFVPIIVSERHLGNQDNNMISVDASWFWFRQNLQLYLEILFDDFSFAKDIFNNFVNKWGVMLGGYWVEPLGLPDLDFRFELVRIQPFVYSHRFAINTYSNYNNAMGHWLGPDSDDWYVEIGRQFHRDFRLGVFWEQRRRGPKNDFNQGDPPGDSRIHFLQGTVERNRIYGLSGQLQVRRDIFVRFFYNYIQSANLRFEEGNDQNNHRLLVNIAVDF